MRFCTDNVYTINNVYGNVYRAKPFTVAGFVHLAHVAHIFSYYTIQLKEKKE